jgi:cbb3-type cytochrome oxidase cytochrome c subunit
MPTYTLPKTDRSDVAAMVKRLQLPPTAKELELASLRSQLAHANRKLAIVQAELTKVKQEAVDRAMREDRVARHTIRECDRRAAYYNKLGTNKHQTRIYLTSQSIQVVDV